MIINIFKSSVDRNTTKVFESALSQAKKTFPQRFEFESDSLESRREKFEGIAVFMALYAWYLKGEASKEAKNLSQSAYDYMFDRFEVALREQGVSDVRIGPEIKKMAAAFHGRLVSYGEAFAAGDTASLADGFMRNHVCDKPKAMSLSISLITEARKMQEQSLGSWIENLENLQKGAYEPRDLKETSSEKIS